LKAAVIYENGGPGEDLARDPLVVEVRLAACVAASLVPSIATTPVLTSPAFAHSASTEPNSPASAASWRARKRAIVAWSGTRLASTNHAG
jgi:hypothetical protein